MSRAIRVVGAVLGLCFVYVVVFSVWVTLYKDSCVERGTVLGQHAWGESTFGCAQSKQWWQW